MSKHRVTVLKVVSAQLSVTAAAAQCGISRGHLHRLLRRYREGGLDGLEPRSRRPHVSPHRTSRAVRDRIVELRTDLVARGLDAGPATIGWHLEREGLPLPSTSTIRRILHAADGKGAMTLRRGGRLYHLKVGAAHARRRVLAIVDEREVTVVALDTGEVLSSHRIEPDKGYWRNQRRDPGRWPGSQETG
jgi:transposase-like protein